MITEIYKVLRIYIFLALLYNAVMVTQRGEVHALCLSRRECNASSVALKKST